MILISESSLPILITFLGEDKTHTAFEMTQTVENKLIYLVMSISRNYKKLLITARKFAKKNYNYLDFGLFDSCQFVNIRIYAFQISTGDRIFQSY